MEERNQIFICGFVAGISIGIIVGSALCILIINSN